MPMRPKPTGPASLNQIVIELGLNLQLHYNKNFKKYIYRFAFPHEGLRSKVYGQHTTAA